MLLPSSLISFAHTDKNMTPQQDRYWYSMYKSNAELDRIFKHIYEDNISGTISHVGTVPLKYPSFVCFIDFVIFYFFLVALQIQKKLLLYGTQFYTFHNEYTLHH